MGLLGSRYTHTHEPPPILTLEAQVLSLQMSSLGILGNLSHGVRAPLPLWKSIINCLSVLGGNSVLLSQVSLLYDRIGELACQLLVI
jgi:hypothetical protein